MDMNLARFGKYPALIQREFLEHKMAFFTVPLVISIFIVLGAVFTALFSSNFMDYVDISDADLNNMRLEAEMEFSDMDEGDWAKVEAAASAVMGMIAAPLFMIFPFIVMFPLLNSLYEERVERSYLFWKSMPVSDVEEVLIKMLLIVVLGPMCLFAMMIVVDFLALLIFTPVIMGYDLPILGVIWSAPFITMWIGAYVNYLAWVLWALPVLAWFMLASSYAPKAPLMYALVPPAAIMILEAILFDRTILGELILSRIATKFGLIMEDVIDFQRFEDGERIASLSALDGLEAMVATLANPSFWAGAVVAGGFLAGAVYFRRFRT